MHRNPYTELDNKLYDRYTMKTMYWQNNTNGWNFFFWIFDNFEQKFLPDYSGYFENTKTFMESELTVQIINNAKWIDLTGDNNYISNKISEMNRPIRIDRRLYLDQVIQFHLLTK